MNFINLDLRRKEDFYPYFRQIFTIHLTLLFVFFLFLGQGWAQDKVRDRGKILADIQSSGLSRVIVLFTSPGIEALSIASQAHKGLTPGEKRGPEKIQAAVEADQALSEKLNGTADGILAKMPVKGYNENQRYNALPLMALTISREALPILEARSE